MYLSKKPGVGQLVVSSDDSVLGDTVREVDSIWCHLLVSSCQEKYLRGAGVHTSVLLWVSIRS